MFIKTGKNKGKNKGENKKRTRKILFKKRTRKILFKNNLGLILIIFGGFLVRIWGVGYGLPNLYNHDEGKLIYTAFYAASNFLRPDIFIHSILVPYLLIPFYGGYFLIGRLLGMFSSSFDFYVSYLADPTALVLIGRVFFVLMSTLVTVTVFLIGQRFYGRRVGIFAAFFLSFCFLFVKESHYIKDEVLAAFFLTGFFYFCLLSLNSKKVKPYLLAGVFGGLAVAAKYIYLPVWLVLGLFSVKDPLRRKHFFWFLFMAVSVFLLTNPYVLLDFPRFFLQTKNLFLTQRMTGAAGLLGRPVWLNFLAIFLPKGLGEPLFLVAILGFLVCLLDFKNIKKFGLSFLVLFLFVSIIFAGGNYPRWAVPLIPFLCLQAGIFLEIIFSKKRFLVFLVGLALMIPNFLRLIKFDLMLTWPDTRSISKVWIENNLPPNSKIIIDGVASEESRAWLGPPLFLSEGRIRAKTVEAEKLGQKAQSLKALAMASQGKIGYDLVAVSRLNYFFDQNQGKYIEPKNMDYYKKIGAAYLISSSWVYPPGEAPKEEFRESLEKNFELIYEARPTVVFEGEPHCFGIDYQALDQAPFLTKGIFGPIIRVYKLKNGDN